MIDFVMAQPVPALILAWLAVVGLGHVAGVAREVVKQPFLFYRHIAEGRRIRAHRREMRDLYAEFGAPAPEPVQIAAEFEPVDEDMAVYRKLERAA